MSDGLVERLRSTAAARTLPEGISLMEIPKVWPGALEAEAAARITELQAELTAARAELVALKDVGDDIADMAVAGANKAIRDTFGSGEANGRERWLVKSGAAAIAPVMTARGRERAAKIARNGCLVPPDGGSPTAAEVDMCDLIAEAILAGAAP